MADTADPHTPATFGWLAFATGAVSLLLAVTVFWAGPFAPQHSAGVSLGELAAEIAKSAARSAAGLEQPAPVVAVRDIDDYLKIAVAVLGGLAIILGAAGLVRREYWRAATTGILLGGGAIVFQLFTWVILAIIGALLLYALVYSLGDSFASIFGG